MLTKRWRSAATGDVEFARKLMTDFGHFCSNKDGALKAFWDKSWDSLINASQESLEQEKSNDMADTSNSSVPHVEEKETVEEVNTKNQAALEGET